MADGSMTACHRIVNLAVTFKGLEMLLKNIYVLEKPVCRLILGADWILASGANIYNENGRLVVEIPELAREPGDSGGRQINWDDISHKRDPCTQRDFLPLPKNPAVVSEGKCNYRTYFDIADFQCGTWEGVDQFFVPGLCGKWGYTTPSDQLRSRVVEVWSSSPH